MSERRARPASIDRLERRGDVLVRGAPRRTTRRHRGTACRAVVDGSGRQTLRLHRGEPRGNLLGDGRFGSRCVASHGAEGCGLRGTPISRMAHDASRSTKIVREAEQHARDRIADERQVVAARQHQRAAIVRFHHEPEDHAEHHRQERHLEVPHRVAEHAEPERQADMKQAGLDRVDARDDEAHR